MRVLSRSSAVSLLVVLLSGCAVAGQQAIGPAASSGSEPAAEDAAAACPVQTPGHLTGDGAGTTAAYVCSHETRAVPGDGVWTFQVVGRVTGGLDPLLRAYAEPDASPDADIVCDAVAYAELVVYLHRDGEVHAVRAPKDACGAPTQRARDAYAALVTKVVWEQPSSRVQSQLSVDSQCPDRYKDMLWVDQLDPVSRPGAEAPAPLPDPLPVCSYRITTDTDGQRVGQLTGSRTLSGGEVRAVNAALAQARRDPGCSRSEQTAFALLDPGRVDETVVALDGCAVAQGDGWWRADDGLRAAVGG